MKNKYYLKCLAVSLCAAVLAGNFAGIQTVSAADITGRNLVSNGSFDDAGMGWTIKHGGNANNNGHEGQHFYLDGKSDLSAEISQKIKIPADGKYGASVWVASNGTGGKFGVRLADGTVLKEVAISKSTVYTQYVLEDIQALKGTEAEIYVSGANDWINGDSFELSCMEQQGDTDEEQPSYIFAGNMAVNPSFANEDGWQFSQGGYASNNGHNGKGDRHFYINVKSGVMKQEIRVPYTGYYKASMWAASAGTGAKFGVKNQSAGETKEVELAANTKYSQYDTEIWLNKGDKAEIYVTGGSGWVNGDDISLEYNTSRFENMAANPAFADDSAWDITGTAAVGGGLAELTAPGDSVSQSIYIPQDGPYYAEVTLKNAENAKVAFAGEESAGITGSQTIRISADNLASPGPAELRVSGIASVTKAEVKFDLESMPNEAPTASDVKVAGDCTAELVLESSYKFADADGHTEGNTVYQWFLADSADGSYEPLEGETSKNITVRAEWEDKYLKLKVTPVDQYAKAGEPVLSEAVGPVDVNLIKNPGFESNGTNWSGISIANSDAYAGLNRGSVKKDGTASQSITVPRSAYYDFEAYIRYTGSKKSTLEIQDEAGNVLGSADVDKSDDWTKVDAKKIPLEEGQKIKIVLHGASDKAYDIDNLSLKKDRTSETPAFKNVKTFKTDPEAFETTIDSDKRIISLKYLFGTDLSKVRIEELSLSEGATASLKKGDILDLTGKAEFTVTGSDKIAEKWTVQAEEKEKKVSLISSNKYLADTFNWAANKLDQFVMTGKTGAINVYNNNYDGAEEAEYIPSYWAGYYDRTAFYTRDFVHQATGGQIAGLADENYSMFEAFAKQCTEARKWYTVWALNFDGSVYTLDYHNENSFVREVPAQFELVEKAYEQYLWSGDKRYIENDELWNFYTNVMTKYVDTHDANGNKVVQEVGTGIFDGSCTYNERGRHVIEAGDAIGSQYQATLAYAGMLKARGDEAASAEWQKKAADLKKYFNDEWSVADNMESGYVCAWGPNGEKYSDFSKETSWFMPLKEITEPGDRNNTYIDFILTNLGEGIGTTSTAPNNLEAYTYIPDMLFPYNRSNDAWKWMKYITSIKDEPHERPIQGTNGDYPEISFTFVSHTIEGMMGVEPNAGQSFVATIPRLPDEVPDVTAQYMQVGDYEIDLTHNSNTDSALTNHADKDITWEARFYGEHPYIQAGGQLMEAKHKEINGEPVSYVTVDVGAGSSVEAQTVTEEYAELVRAASAVIDKINGIGEVTLESKGAIAEARAAYEALTPEGKALVTNLNVLEAAEARLAELESGKEDPDPDDGGNGTGKPDDTDKPDGTGKPDGSNPPGGSGTPGSGDKAPGSTDNQGAVKTGDSTQIIAAFAALAAALGGILLSMRRKLKKNTDESDL